MLQLLNISYTHPDKETLFENIHLCISKQEKTAIIGNNGAGKSVLLKIIAGELLPTEGHKTMSTSFYYVPQVYARYNHFTVARALQIEKRLKALKEILDGTVTEDNLSMLNDDWTIEERCREAFNEWQLSGISLMQKMETLSGGQRTRVLLAGISIHQPELVLLDEPSNHLDTDGRRQLYRFIQSSSCAMLVVSHDRTLLNLMDTTCELQQGGLAVYGGNYDFYTMQKEAQQNARIHDLHNREKELRKAKEKARVTAERQQKADNSGKKKQKNAGVARIMMNTLRNKAENSTARTQSIHAEKTQEIAKKVQQLRAALPDTEKMKLSLSDSVLHRGKILFAARDLNYYYGPLPLWKEDLHLEITSGERIALKGQNGSGKTTLLRLIMGTIRPGKGSVYSSSSRIICMDQDYSQIDQQLSVYEQMKKFCPSDLAEHDIKIRLHRFLFTKEDWDKPCSMLSGGECMRLVLCCLAVTDHPPDMVILDEPTNNIDIQNIEILTAAIHAYQGTLIVVSHDTSFLDQISIERTIQLVC